MYVLGVLLLIFEALTSVIEPFPIAYLIDFLHGARPSLRDLGWPSLVPSELETLLLLTLAIIGIAAVNSAAEGRPRLLSCTLERLRAKGDEWLVRYQLSVAGPRAT